MATPLKKQIAINRRNTFFIMLAFIMFISLVGYIFAWLFDDLSVLIWFIVIAVVYTVGQYFLADRIALSASGARQIGAQDNPRLYKIVKKLAEKAKLPMPKVYLIDDSAPNAFATGRDYSHACVAATTGLLEIMDDDELEAVMAHEISHVRNYDIRISLIAFGLTMLIGLVADLGLRFLIYGKSRSEERSPVGLILALITLILSPLVAAIVRLAVSRQREYLADASAANILGAPDAMISALKKLDAHARPMHQQNVASESMFIANPLKKNFLGDMLSTHPSMLSRIERLEASK